MAAPTAKQLIREIEDELQVVKSKVQDIGYEVRTLQAKAKDLEKALSATKSELVPRVEYNLIRSIVFGMLGLILIGVMTAIIGTVLV